MKEKTIFLAKLLYKGSECSFENNNMSPICNNQGTLKAKIKFYKL